MACDCTLTIDFLRRIGAEHAARMHEGGAADSPRVWSNGDWLLHMEEEERLLFPIFDRHGFWREAERLRDEHDVLRGEIRRFGRIRSDAMLAAHSKLEDDVIKAISKIESPMQATRSRHLSASRRR